MNMQHEGDSIAPALFSEIDEQEERVEELFPDDDTVDVLKGLIESKQEEEPISLEDLAWADSCLVIDPELPMESWISLREALLDSITAFATSYEENNAAGVEEDEAGNDKHMELGEEQEIINDGGDDTAHIRAAGIDEEEAGNGKCMELGEEQEIFNDRGDNAHIRAAGIDEEEAGNGKSMELGEEQGIVSDRGDTDHIRTKVNKNGGGHDDDDGEAKIVDTKKEFESRESIFKVWDLREEEDEDEDDELIPELHSAVADLRLAEKEDQFITELNGAVAESIIREKRRLLTDESDIADDRKLDELISSMGDLSIKPLS